MPVGNKKSRRAKKRLEEGRKQGRAGFATCAAKPPSPNASDYSSSASDDNQLESDSGDSSDKRARERKKAGVSVKGLQRLYSDFLPPHLQPSAATRAKRQKISNRPAVYPKTSRTTCWRKVTEMNEAAQGCATLDAFIVRKVCAPVLKGPKSEA